MLKSLSIINHCPVSLLQGLTIILSLLIPNDQVVGQPTCQLRKSKDSIRVYTCQTSHSKFNVVKANFTVNASYSEIIAMFLDVENFSKWQYKTRYARVLKYISDSEFVYYAEIEAPWPVSNRDIILQMTITHDPLNQMVTINSKALPEYIEKRDNLIRIHSFHSTWTFKSNGKNNFHAEYVTQVDPSGSLPAGLVNIFAAQGPYETFRLLKQQIRSHNKLHTSLLVE